MSEDSRSADDAEPKKEPPQLSIVPPPEPVPEPLGGDSKKLYTLDNMPPVLMKQREAIRKMMDLRCQQPDSPIPAKLSARAADFIMMLVMIRANARIARGHSAFPSQEAMQDDIARAAETTEITIEQNVLEAIESLNPAPSILHR